jgi:CubicO group peptidase (beta-lactamase class C family)
VSRKRLGLILLAIGLPFVLAAQEKAAFTFPRTAQGERIAAYFAAFNSGDDARLTEFFREHWSAASLSQVPLQERLQRSRGLRQQTGRLEPQRILSESPAEVRLLAKDAQGQWLEMGFAFEAEKPGKIRGIMINQVDEADLQDLGGPPLTRAEALREIGVAIDKQVAADAFSGVVLVARQGEALFEQAYGFASLEYRVPNRLDTRFNLGSINKVFTQLAVEQLAKSGRLSLDDPIGKFLPDYPNPDARQATVRQLLDMTSGIGDFFGPEYMATPKDRIRDLADYLPLFASKPLLFKPGAGRQYSNGGYVVLGLIIEKASGQSYFDYVAENIYRPAGMENSGHAESDVPETNLASGYTRRWDEGNHEKEPRRNNIHTRPARGSSAGGGYATARDLVGFISAVRSGKLVGPAGWLSGPTALAGGAPGINAELDIDPAPGYVVVVLSNYDPPAATTVAKKIAGLLRRVKE